MVFGITEAQIGTAKEIFPSLFIQFGGSIPEGEIAQSIFENNFDNAIVTKSLERKVALQKRRTEEQTSRKDKNSISDFFHQKSHPSQMIQSIVSDSSEGEELSRSYRSFFPSSEVQRVQDDKQTVSTADAESKTIVSVVSSSSLSVEDEEVDTVVMNVTNETVKGTDEAELSIGAGPNVKENSGVEIWDEHSVMATAESGSSPASPLHSDNLEMFQVDNWSEEEEVGMSMGSNDGTPMGSNDGISMDPNDGTPIDPNNKLHRAESLHSEESLLSESSSSESPPIISVDESSLSCLHKSADRSTTDLFTVEESPLETYDVVSDSSSSESIDLNATFYPEETYSPTKGRNTPSKETNKPPSKDWKRRLEEANEVEAISDDSFHHSELFQMDEASLLQLAHTKLPYFHSIRELRARKYDFPFDKLFKVSKRTKTVEQQEPHPANRKRTYRKRSRSSKRRRRN